MNRIALRDGAPAINEDASGVAEVLLNAAQDRTLRFLALVPNAQRLERQLGVKRTDHARGTAVFTDLLHIFQRQWRTLFENALKIRIAEIRKAETRNDEATRIEPRELAFDRPIQTLNQRHH